MVQESTPQHVLAEAYDAGAVAYSRYWAPALNRHATDLVAAVPHASTPQTVLDVATGAGTLIPALRRLAGPDGTLLAVDRSLGMLRRAPADAARLQADAGALPVPSDSVDVVVLAFVLFLLPDARQAVAEAARVLHRNGWLLAATWGNQQGSLADVVAREELDASGAPEFPPLPRSDALTDSPERLSALLADSFVDVRCSTRPLDATFSPEAALSMRTGCGQLGWRYARLARSVQAEVSARISARLALLPASAFVDRSEVLLTTARRR